MKQSIAVINAGSSSVKFTVFSASLEPQLKGLVDGIGTNPHIKCKSGDDKVIKDEDLKDATTHKDVTALILKIFDEQLGKGAIGAIGHRVVHGGKEYSEPMLVTKKVLGELEALTVLAPLHQPHNLAPIKNIMEASPSMPQVACFDTAFHRTHPEIADKLAIPRKFSDEGVQKYGFHGLSYEYIASQLSDYTPASKVVVCHLGNGASACAIKDGKSVDSTMGFTALDGLIMGTRCGSIDPGVLLYFMQEKNMTGKQIEKILYKESGLLGVSGISNDVRELLESKSKHAAEAIDLFCYRIVREVGALASVMGGMEALVFTAGIGENSSVIRQKVCEGLEWFGLEIDKKANKDNDVCINTFDSGVDVFVLPTNEERMIAKHVQKILKEEKLAKAA